METTGKSKLICVDLFSGAGGLSEGLSEAGFNSIYANEINPVYASTYAANHPSAFVSVDDIRDIDAEITLEMLGIKPGELDLLAGGPPCQGFSINAPKRSNKDPRNHLFREFLRFVEAFQPRAVLIENVPGLVSFSNGNTLHAIIEALADLGYGADVRILGAPYYGVPQMRWRTLVIALRGSEVPAVAFPQPVRHAPLRANFTTKFNGKEIVQRPNEETSAPFTTLREAIGDLPVLRNGERGERVKEYPVDAECEYQRKMRVGSLGVLNHEAPRLAEINLERMRYVEPGGNWTSIPDDLLPKGMKEARKSDHTKRYGRPRWNEISSTILTKCDPHWGAFFHPDQDRSFTVREAARIQSFPDTYTFGGSMAEQFAQVGNAVPPLLASAVGNSLREILEG